MKQLDEFEQAVGIVKVTANAILEDKKRLDLELPRLQAQKRAMQEKVDGLSTEFIRLQKLKVKITEDIESVRNDWKREKERVVAEIQKIRNRATEEARNRASGLEAREEGIEYKEQELQSKIEAHNAEVEKTERRNEAIEKQRADLKLTEAEVAKQKKQNNNDFEVLIARENRAKQKDEILEKDRMELDKTKAEIEKQKDITEQKEKVAEEILFKAKGQLKKLETLETNLLPKPKPPKIRRTH